MLVWYIKQQVSDIMIFFFMIAIYNELYGSLTFFFLKSIPLDPLIYVKQKIRDEENSN